MWLSLFVWTWLLTPSLLSIRQVAVAIVIVAVLLATSFVGSHVFGRVYVSAVAVAVAVVVDPIFFVCFVFAFWAGS